MNVLEFLLIFDGREIPTKRIDQDLTQNGIFIDIGNGKRQLTNIEITEKDGGYLLNYGGIIKHCVEVPRLDPNGFWIIFNGQKKYVKTDVALNKGFWVIQNKDLSFMVEQPNINQPGYWILSNGMYVYMSQIPDTLFNGKLLKIEGNIYVMFFFYKSSNVRTNFIQND